MKLSINGFILNVSLMVQMRLSNDCLFGLFLYPYYWNPGMGIDTKNGISNQLIFWGLSIDIIDISQKNIKCIIDILFLSI